MIKTIPLYIGIAIFYGAGLILRSAYGVGGGILLLTALFLSTDIFPMIRKEREIVGFLITIFLLFVFPLLYHHAAGREYDRFSRIFAIIPIFLLFCRYSVPVVFWTTTLSMGTLVAFSFALLSNNDQAGRFGGIHHPIQFGDLALLTGFLALTSFPYWQKKFLSFFTISGFLAGLVASLLSGSRGGWIAIFPMTIFLVFHLFPKQRKNQFYFLCLLFLVITCLSPIAYGRISDIWQDLKAFGNGNSNTSLGLRLEMWQLAGKLFAEKPLLGWGSSQLQQALNQLLIAQHIPVETMKNIHHLHNDFFDSAARFGLIGLFPLLLLYLVPLIYFFKCWKRGHYHAGAGVILSLSFIIFSLSQSILQHQSGIIFYLITLSLLLSFTSKQNNNFISIMIDKWENI